MLVTVAGVEACHSSWRSWRWKCNARSWSPSSCC